MTRPESLRTLGIVAHVDAGKTTLTERILFEAGVRRAQGSVDDGTAATDWLPQEQARGISIQSAAVRVDWGNAVLQILDTPGHVDFTAEVARCMRVLDSVLVVLDGVRGVESQTAAVWKQAEQWRCARMVFVNKLDRPTADFEACLQALRRQLECLPLVLAIPLFTQEGNLLGIGDVVRSTVSLVAESLDPELAARWDSELQLARELLLEECGGLDDALLQAILASEEIGEQELLAALQRITVVGLGVPVLAGSAMHGIGVDILLDAVDALFPSLAGRGRQGVVDWFPVTAPKATLKALVFKVDHSPAQTTAMARIFCGSAHRGQKVWVPGQQDAVSLDSIWIPQASGRLNSEDFVEGEIFEFEAPPWVRTGHTLVSDATQDGLRANEFPCPVLSVLLEPEHSDHLPVVWVTLDALAADDPTLRVEHDGATGLPRIAGLGELHLDIVAERVRERTGHRLRASSPRVAHRWTVHSAATATAGAPHPYSGTTAAVSLEPLGSDAPSCVMAAATVAPHLARVARAALEEWIRTGGKWGEELVGLRLEINRVEQGTAGATDAAIAAAIEAAATLAVELGGPIQLEPVVRFCAYAPEASGSVVLADLQARRASIDEVSSGRLGAKIIGTAPLEHLIGYATRLRSLTQGHGMLDLALDGYGWEPVAQGPMGR
jgi:elongation factor G